MHYEFAATLVTGEKVRFSYKSEFRNISSVTNDIMNESRIRVREGLYVFTKHFVKLEYIREKEAE